jgi:hypothetical protein
MTTIRFTRVLPLLPAAALILALAACAPATTTGSSSSSNSPSASASPKPVTQPDFVFGNDCSSVVSSADITKDLGIALNLQSADPWLDESNFAIPSVGGIRCDWYDPTAAHAQDLDLIVLPASAASASSYPAFNCVSNAGPTLGDCNFNLVASGYWFSGLVQLAENTTNAQAKAAAMQLVTQLTATAAAAPPAPAVVTITGAWAKPASCAALDSAAGLSTILGSPNLTLESSDENIENGNPDGYTGALSASPYLPCSWQTAADSPTRSFTVYLYPGGAWAKPHLISSASTTLSVTGADSAYISPGIEGTTLLDVFVGANAFVVAPNGTDITTAQLQSIAAAVIKGMS